MNIEKIIKQPNGKYCIFLYGGGLVELNLTEQDIIDDHLKKCEEEIKSAIQKAEGFGEIIKHFLYMQETLEYEKPSEALLKEMGFEHPYEELIKYLPRRPLHPQYVSCSFATYANCPNCGGRVQNGIGFKQEKCECGQRLEWGR